MIGGIDRIFNKNTPEQGECMNFAVRILRAIWPKLIVQNADDIQPYQSFMNIPYTELSEIFVYENYDSFESWSNAGATADNLNKMIHVIEDYHEITLVIDDPKKPVNRFIIDAMDRFTTYNLQRYSTIRKAA